ncbi:NAD-binding protein [Amycolatopsis rubida]|uniref:Uncharacterized protein n=1 Tax=Amycolatopsis rubida TaxID=112413 RepID=A0A1I5QT58_9PSEU|nr:NAD-binding protein [Amycolatopsis rubida]SFP49320.1 hypothetical protein SAMN05421854_105429 [Amycolatopsis rubida]
MSKIVVFGAGGAGTRSPRWSAIPRATATWPTSLPATSSARQMSPPSPHDAVVNAAAVYGEGIDPHAFFTNAAHALVTGLSQARAGRGRVPALLPGARSGVRGAARRRHRAGLGVRQPGAFDREGGRTGRYEIGERFAFSAKISYADFAVASLGEIENPRHHRVHLAVA